MATTWRQRILRWYESESLFWSAVGMWLKFAYEFVVVGVPISVIVVLLGLSFEELTLNVRPTSDSVAVIWVGVTLTVLGIVWCFTYVGEESSPEGDAE